MKSFQLKHTESFCQKSEISYAQVRSSIEKMFKDMDFEICEDDYGLSLAEAINLSGYNTVGFLVAALIDYEDNFTTEDLAELADGVIVGSYNCPECGGADLENDEVISKKQGLTHAIVRCPICKYTTETHYYEDD